MRLMDWAELIPQVKYCGTISFVTRFNSRSCDSLSVLLSSVRKDLLVELMKIVWGKKKVDTQTVLKIC